MSEKKEMTAVEFLQKMRRMCDSFDVKCDTGCPLQDLKRKINKAICREAITDCPEEAVAIVQKWAEEHPVKTRMSDFFEKHPNATKREDGRPLVCAFYIGYEARERCEPNENCLVCWNKPLEVKE